MNRLIIACLSVFLLIPSTKPSESRAEAVVAVPEAAVKEPSSSAEAPAASGTPHMASPPSTPREVLLQSFAELDRTLIPAIYAARMDDSAVAPDVFSRLSAAWKKLLSKHASVPFDSRWKETVSAVSTRLEKALLLQKEEALEEAYFTLEEIRAALVECRTRNSMQYFPDSLAEYGTSIDKILQEISLAGVARPVTAIREELRRKLVPSAVRVFAKIRKQPFEPSLYGFGSDKEARLRSLLDKQKQLLDDLSDAVEEGSTDTVFETAKQLKPGFDRVYRLFGSDEA